MSLSIRCNQVLKNCISIILLISVSFGLNAQRSKADSLKELLIKEKQDSNKVRLLWQLADQLNIYDPDTALHLSQEALYLAVKVKYEEGQSRSLGVLANTFIKIGNYPRALELNIQKLQLEEKRSKPRNLASVLMNIGVIYVLQKEFEKALYYYELSDSVITRYKIEDLRYYSLLNLGDVYNRLNISDSAYKYFTRSLLIAESLQEFDFIGASLTGLGHSFLKMGKLDSSQRSYHNAIVYLQSVNDDELVCEASLGLANLFKELKQLDSSKKYAALSYSIAKKAGFVSIEMEAAEFLTEHFKQTKNIDSAFTYINYVKTLNDSVNSRNRIRESQVITSNEQFRQYELEESNKRAKKERKQRLQLLFIGIFIPGLFLITLLLSRVRVNIKLIKALGILSLLFFFEYLTILLHPVVADLTNHTPWLEILIFVAVGAVLIPAHHKLEHWLIEKLLQQRIPDDKIIIPNTEIAPNEMEPAISPQEPLSKNIIETRLENADTPSVETVSGSEKLNDTTENKISDETDDTGK